ncbi:MAG: ABC transporter ATP-binding protein [Gallionella sp.]|nr:ABC transporter ATP-binding protein [Gallionella sp.]
MITISNLGKAYKQYPTRWSRLAEWIIPFSAPRHQLKWILQDLNFKVNPGEAVGIIGINGAGKSTLLKMITGTTQPTTGSVSITGRVAALLELGMGFHPDFTGRQNAFMAGQLLGMSVEEIASLMPEIEAFAEIGDYMDQPVRVYSSGMQVRLAFSVATARRPDILIVDEALAVGDIYFQQKCFERIRNFRDAGTTMLFVSHSLGTVLDLCTRAVYLRQGKIVHDGSPKEAVDLFQADLLVSLEKTHSHIGVLKGAAEFVTAANISALETEVTGEVGSVMTGDAACICVRFINAYGHDTTIFYGHDVVTLEIAYRLKRDLDDPHIGFKIRNRQGVVMYETNTYCMHKPIGSVNDGGALVARFKFCPDFLPDQYTVTVGLGNRGFGEGSFEQVVSYLHGVLSFSVMANPEATRWSGLVNLNPILAIETF